MTFLVPAQQALNHGSKLMLAALLVCAVNVQAASTTPEQTDEVPAGAAGHVLEHINVVGRPFAGYTVSDESGGTKTDAPILDTPMAVQVVPAAVIEDRQIRTALEAVRNLSGVQPSTYEFYDQFLIRGFDSGYGTTFRNGLQLRGITEAVNMAFVDRIEVIKGPASMLYGRVEPGGFVNVVTRRPQDAAAYSAEMQFGDWGFRRVSADATGPFFGDGSLLYRLTGDLDRGDSWVANAHRDNKAIAGSVAWRPNERFDALLELEHYDYKTAWLDASVPVIGDRPANVPLGFTILFPQSWTEYPYRTVRTLFALSWTYRLNGAWKITSRAHYVDSNENQQGVYADAFDGAGQFAGVRFTHSGPDWLRTTDNVNLDLVGDFATAGIRHQLLIGVDVSRFTDDTPGSTGDLGDGLPISVFSPVYPDYSATLAILAASDSTNVLWRDRSKDQGLYVQDQLELGAKWRVLVGGRYDQATDSYSDVYGSRDQSCYPTCTGYPVTPYPTDRAFSPRAGLLYKAAPTTSAYASYARSFGDANGRDNLGNALKPQIGTQYELGLKYVRADGKLTASATLFDLTKTNIPEYDPVNYFPHIVGAARSRGLELDASGAVTEQISLLASYTYDHALITDDPLSGTQGKHLSGVAPHAGSVWIKYDGAPTASSGWSIGAGVSATGARWGDDLNTWQLPGFARLDLMAGYRTHIGGTAVSARVNLTNAFDKVYFDHGGYGAAAYGAPRTLMGAIRVEF